MPSAEIPLFILSFILGSIIGSFLNVCIYRLPREESIVYPGSHCTSCKKSISFYHNIPILSYIFLGGRCSHCNSKISFSYPLVEILSGLLFVATLWKFGMILDTLFYLLFISGLIVITFVDLKHMIIPNVITYPGILVGILYKALTTNWQNSLELVSNFSFGFQNFFELLNEVPILDSLFGVILGGGILLLIAYTYEIIRKRQGMGMGDVKLLALIGAFLGWQGVFFVIFLSSILGSIVGLSIIITRKGDLKYALSFGPFLSIAAIIYIFTGGFKIFL
ncbi:MAG: prepilin peptidase [Candidatus Dadabacteria bacterium]|nr:prepilin peptidase [Candidatus Dadabacteria bacterium]MCZ6527806.1 prepilin peptidase [Candidatus Dadabacteria bacterium]MCZ6791578.1 prepilin peptidase [Candidatus Dadabacteria bacterium]